MTEDNKMHIMALTGEYQLALRLLLAHHFQMQLRYVLDFLVLNPTFTNVSKKWSTLVSAFQAYEDLTHTYPTAETVAKARTRVFIYNTPAMNCLVSAVERFTKDSSESMPADAFSFISLHYDGLKSLIETSCKHMYTQDEIKRAGK